MLTTYKNEKNKILNQYKKILKLSNILPKDISIENIKEKQKQLESEHFFVSFTGQINSGKSTLINALLFGEEVIPVETIAHTAKITIIKYGEEPRIEATFYNKEEWKQLESNQDFYEEYLKPDIEKSINQGLYVDEIINTKAKVQKEDGLNNLKEYVARDRKYTPFVNLVTLYHPNKILKEITIVDTPGTNDPDEQRDKVAKEWIHKTNANIYITYAGQAMDKVDIDFIDKFLLAVPKEQKLTVLNKIDSINDSDGLEEYISELLADTRLKRREVVSDRDSLILVSALGALIDKMSTKNLPLNEDLEFYAEQLEEKGFLEPENHGLSRLEKMIEQKLIENKGKNILESHSEFLDSIFEKKIIDLTKEIYSKQSTLKYLLQDNKDLDKELNKIESSQKKLTNVLDNISKDFSKKLKKIFEIKENDFTQIKRKNINYSKKKIKEIKNSSNYKNEVLWILKEALDENYDELRELITHIRVELSGYLKNKITDFKSVFLTNNDNFKDISYSIEIYTQDVTKEMNSATNNLFSTNAVNDVVGKSSGWYQWIDTKTKLGQINSALNDKIEKFFDEEIKNLVEKLELEIDNHIKVNLLEEMKNKIDEILTNKENEIEEYLADIRNKKELITQSQDKKEALEKELKMIESYKKEVI